MFKTRITILLCLVIAFTAAGSYLRAEQESDKPEIKTKRIVKVAGPEEDFIMPLPEMEDFEYLAMVPKPPHEGKDWAERRAKHEERIGLFRLWRIMDELKLSDDQVDKFFPLMRQMLKRDRERAKQKRELVKSLREELKKEKPSESELKRLMTEIKNQARLAWQERMDNLDQFKGLLTVEQQARLLLSMNEVERDIWESIARARMSPYFKPEFKFDREKFEQHMKEIRKNLDSLNIRLHMKGLPGLPEYMEEINKGGKDEETQP